MTGISYMKGTLPWWVDGKIQGNAELQYLKTIFALKTINKMGVKIWSLTDSHTGFMLWFSVYTEKDTSEKGQLTKGLSSSVAH